MQNKKEYNMNIGGASIILLLVVFALSIFAVLSIRSSYHELKLSQKTREAVENYYSADSKAEAIYQSLKLAQEELLEEGVISPDASTIIEQAGLNETVNTDEFSENLTYRVSLDYNTDINVCLSLDYNQNDVSNLPIISWRVLETADASYEPSDVDLWDGIISD